MKSASSATVVEASYEAQRRIRRDAEERSVAHQDLASWMESLQTKPKVEKKLRAKPKGSSSSCTPAPAPSKVADPSSCEDERLQGNQFFAQGKYEDAVQCYTRWLSKSDALTSPVIYSNRAMAHLKLKSWSQAEADATSALEINPLHFKSYQRRSVARLSMGKLRAAMADACAAKDSCVLAMKDAPSADTSVSNSSLAEIEKLQKKVEKALIDATKRAPRRKIPVAIKANDV